MKIKVYRLNFYKLCLAALLLIPSSGLYAQGRAVADQVSGSVSGIVSNSSGEPVTGASIVEKGTNNWAVSDARGGYNITAGPNAVLVVTVLGYDTQEVAVNNRTVLNIRLSESNELLDEVIVVAYGTQKRVTVTGAISAVRGDEITSTKNENVYNMLTGKVSGLRITQNSSEPGQFSNNIDIRGFGSPLIVIDGIPRGNLQRIDATDIESISVLKDASAAVYGVKAGNGVILVTTKRGEKGKSFISYDGNITWQKPSNFPELVNAVDWMTLYNEKLAHNVDNPSSRYTQADFDEYLNGTKKSTDWKNEVFRNSAPQTQHTLSASGGSDLITYYASVGYQNQESFLKTNAINYEKYTMRSNISAKVHKNLQLDVNISGHVDERQQTPNGAWDIVRAMWLMRPVDPVWYDKEQGMYGAPDNSTLLNPVAAMNSDISGLNSYKSKWLQTGFSLTYDVPFVKGLAFKGFYSYDFIMNDNKEFKKSYQLYKPDETTVTWNMTNNKPYNLARYYYVKNHNLWNIRATYDRTFGNHSVTGLLLFESSHNVGDNFRGSRQVMLPVQEVFAGESDNQKFEQDSGSGALYDYANNSFVGRVNYDYAHKYLLEVAFRHEASSKFADSYQWVTTPSISAGWRISEEKFWKNTALRTVNEFKLRSSYGMMGYDGGLNYQFITGYNYPASGGDASKLPNGSLFGDSYYTASNDKGLANKAFTWYDITMFNAGFDAEAWNGLLGITAEYFRRETTGIPTTRSGVLPGIVGVGLPQENLNSYLDRGFEIELSHRNRYGDFSYNVTGNVAYTRRRQLHYEMAEAGNSYINWRTNVNDRDEGIWWGYGTNGRITNWDQIYYNPTLIGRGSVIGDYLYEDWNGDGMISELDLYPLATNHTTPLINYGLTISAAWRGIDLSMLWQGASGRYTSYSEFLVQPLWADTNAVSDFMDRWRPLDPSASPYDPATKWVEGYYAYSGTIPNQNSKFNMQDASYVRLKNLEIGYTLPKNWLTTVNIQSFRIYVSGYNMLTFTKMRYMDPEFPSGNTGYNYPLNKTYTVGVNVKF